MKRCFKCQKGFADNLIQQHHFLPYTIFKTYDCPTINLCRKHHNELHERLELLEYTTTKEIFLFTTYWLLGKEIFKHKEELYPLCSKCKDADVFLTLFSLGSNYVILYCPICGYKSEKNYNSFILWERKELRQLSLENRKLFLKGKEEKDGDTKTITE
jgi:endogenous inhibitor of DNA gyrase (YacG/DUF329 family)